jgi:hypothetical protein
MQKSFIEIIQNVSFFNFHKFKIGRLQYNNIEYMSIIQYNRPTSDSHYSGTGQEYYLDKQ